MDTPLVLMIVGQLFVVIGVIWKIGNESGKIKEQISGVQRDIVSTNGKIDEHSQDLKDHSYQDAKNFAQISTDLIGLKVDFASYTGKRPKEVEQRQWEKP